MRMLASAIRILMALGVFAFSILPPSAAPVPVPEPGISGSEDTAGFRASKGMDALSSFGVRIAGTYLVARASGNAPPATGPSRILNIFADGNLASIQSSQFSAGAIGKVKATWFSNQHGTWKPIGDNKIEATVLDLNYDRQTGKFLGIGVGRYILQFDNRLQTVTGTVTGNIFSPGVDPWDPDATPIASFQDEFEAQRVTVGN